MRRTAGLFLAAALVLGGQAAVQADEAAAIIDKAVKAHGGADKLAKFQGEQWKAKGVMKVMGMELPYTADYSFQRPNLFRFDMAAEFGGQKIAITATTDGKQAWESAMGQVREMEAKKFEEFRHMVYVMGVSQLAPLKDKAFTLTAAGEAKVNDKPALAVKVAHKDRRDVTLFFDKESGLLVKSETRVNDEFTNKEVAQETFFMDYQDKDGHKRFQKMIVKRDGKAFLEESFSEQKSLEKLDAKLFAKP